MPLDVVAQGVPEDLGQRVSLMAVHVPGFFHMDSSRVSPLGEVHGPILASGDRTVATCSSTPCDTPLGPGGESAEEEDWGGRGDGDAVPRSCGGRSSPRRGGE